jgi:hypothetical protein
VIRNLVVQPITQEPEVIELLGDDSHQFAFTLDIIQEQQQPHAKDNFGRYRFIIPATRGVGYSLTDKAQVQHRIDSLQRMITAHPLIQVDPIVPEWCLADLALPSWDP